MRAIIAIARLDLELTLSDRSAIMWMFIMPVVFATFFGLVLGGETTSPSDSKVALTIVDSDGSAVSRAFTAALADERLAISEITAEARDEAPGTVRTLVIPEGFGTNVLEGTQVAVRLEKESSANPEATMVAQARIAAAIAGLIARLVEASEQSPVGSALNVEALLSAETPADLISVEARFAGRARTVPNGFTQSIPGNAVMFVMLVALTYGAFAITSDRQSGLLRRLATVPLARHQLIIGKLMGRFALSSMQITAYVAAGLIGGQLFGIETGPLAAVWVVLMVFALTVAPLGLLFGGLFTDPDRAASVGVIATMVMAAFGGCWWPTEVISRPLQMLALAFPSGWAMQALHGVISFGHGLTGVAPSLLALLGYFVVFATLAIKSLRID